ncbi:MAG TPA: four helix bundle protein [Terrimicrobiaceae bacterium]|nr:four helix bundle protein [Terrimicrobiaceae bacterium]
MNAQDSTFNAHRSNAHAYDLEDRLLEYTVRIICVTASMKHTSAGWDIADQLLRLGTSPFGNHGEAAGAESGDDFLHKLRVCFKEPRELRRWWELVRCAELVERSELPESLIGESNELILRKAFKPRRSSGKGHKVEC